MNVQNLIDLLNEVEDKELPVCTYDGMDIAVSKSIVQTRLFFWDHDTFKEGQAVYIQ